MLHITLFGKFSAMVDGRPIGDIGSRKAQELLTYLLLYRNQPHPRELLASMLWGDCTTIQSKAYLRKALWQIQTALSPCPALASELLRVESDWVQLNEHAELMLDVNLFERACERARGVSGEQLDEACFAQLRAAAGLYQGNLLEGCYQDWCLHERERLQTIYLALLDKLMAYCEAHHAFEAGLAYGSQSLRYDRAREQTHQRMMRLCYRSGDRTAALRQYERCCAALRDDLCLEPAESTLLLYRQICDNQLEDTDPPLARADSSALTQGTLHEAIERLQHIQQTLSEFQCRVQQEILTIRRFLHD